MLPLLQLYIHACLGSVQIERTAELKLLVLIKIASLLIGQLHFLYVHLYEYVLVSVYTL